jgi:hypothetical protein
MIVVYVVQLLFALTVIGGIISDVVQQHGIF